MIRKLPVFYYTCFLLTILNPVVAQYSNVYVQEYLGPEFHSGRREEVRKKIYNNSLAIFFSNPVRNRTNDVDYQYRQDSDFLYLTGFLEPNAVLILSKNEIEILGKKSSEFIFIPERNPQTELWNGKRLGVEGVEQILNIKPAFIASDLFQIDFNKVKGIDNIMVRWPKGAVNNSFHSSDLYDLMQHIKESSIEFESVGLTKIMAQLREVKTDEELILLRKAIDITCEAHNQLIKTLNVSMTEIQSQAVLEYFFKLGGAEYTGYPSIVGGAENSCILHYVHNRRKLFPGELLLFDAGAEYHGYTADVTRTVPVNGKYTAEQRTIYNLVLKAQLAAIDVCQPGASFKAPHDTAFSIISRGLMDLGIIENEDQTRLYFMHGTSHYLGLDVHDAGTYGKLKEGNVITVEPGIYIAEGSPCDKKWWNIGVRIEDDILITKDGYEDLSSKSPKTIEEIEKLMESSGILELIEN